MSANISSKMKDLHISSKFSSSYFLRVSKTDMMFVEVIPFRTSSQVDAGFTSSWFSQEHLQELVMLLRTHLTELYLPQFIDMNLKDSSKNKNKSKNFILSGEQLRAACNFKTNTETNYHLIPTKVKGTNKNSSGSENRFQEITMLNDKLFVYVCPRSSSSVLHLSQLLTPDQSHFQEDNEDISKYFQPISSKGSTK